MFLGPHSALTALEAAYSAGDSAGALDPHNLIGCVYLVVKNLDDLVDWLDRSLDEYEELALSEWLYRRVALDLAFIAPRLASSRERRDVVHLAAVFLPNGWGSLYVEAQRLGSARSRSQQIQHDTRMREIADAVSPPLDERDRNVLEDLIRTQLLGRRA